jgi:hypothetical protein
LRGGKGQRKGGRGRKRGKRTEGLDGGREGSTLAGVGDDERSGEGVDLSVRKTCSWKTRKGQRWSERKAGKQRRTRVVGSGEAAVAGGLVEVGG